MLRSQNQGGSCIENNKEQKEILLLSRSRVENTVIFKGAWFGGYNEYYSHEGLLSV